MQDALPYRTWHHNTLSNDGDHKKKSMMNGNNKTASCDLRRLSNVVEENNVVVFSRRSCCMSHVVRCLLQGLGVNPAVCEVEEKDESKVVDELEKISGGGGDEGRVLLPAVFIGGKFFGGLDRVMAAHISGELTPVLKKAGALWL